MVEIRCANCGGTHATARDVRACFLSGPAGADQAGVVENDLEAHLAELDRFVDADGADADVDPSSAGPADGQQSRPDATADVTGRGATGRLAGRAGGAVSDGSGVGPARRSSPPGSAGRPRTVPAPTTPLPRDPAAWAGPEGLGRGLVITPGATVPAPWQDAPVVRLNPTLLDLAEDGSLADLTRWWAQRRRFVVEWDQPSVTVANLHAPLLPVPETDEREPWQVGVAFEFAADRLGALLNDHAVDARDPNAARYRPAETAVAIGAAPSDQPGIDAIDRDGTPLVLDGGPMTPGVLLASPQGPDLALPGPTSLVGGANPAGAGKDGGVRVVPVALLAAGVLRELGGGASVAELAPDQLTAVSHRGGAARIIAPAGSGKTRVLTERARLLLQGWQVPPQLVTLVAFNVRAAEEMRQRTQDLPGLHIRTLNSLALAIVNGSGPFLARPDGRSLATIDEFETRRILEKLVRYPRRAGTDPAAVWLEALAAVRLALRDPAHVEADFGGDIDGFAQVLPRYREELARRAVVDYDEQITAAIERLLREPEARRVARQACRLLLVDEFQDLAPAHLLLIRLLSAPTFDCFGVGDDDQTIYGYVGASPDWLVNFDRWFPGAADHPLQINYRCPPAVVRAAANLLTRNRHRVPKEIHPDPGRADGADELRLQPVHDVAATTCEQVIELVNDGVAPADVAVLTRVNVTLLAVQLRLAAAGVPIHAPVDLQLLGRSGVRAALAWVALAAAAQGPSANLPGGLVADAARRPPRAISPKLLEWMGEQRSLDGLRRLGTRLSQARDADKVEAFVADLQLLAGLVRDGADTAGVLAAVADRIGLGAAMDTLDSSRGAVDRSTHGDDLAALRAVAHLHPDPAGFGGWLRRSLEETRQQSRPDGVQLATIHRVKGREWPYVFVHDASDGLLPHRLATDIEEERRVFHVALTRSSVRTTVVIDAAAPSPFVAELAEPGPQLSVELGASLATAVTRGGRSGRGGAAAGAINTKAAAPGAGSSPANQALVEQLKAWRRERARRDSVPAYVVLPDKAIDDVARRAPGSLVELSRCHGIGPAKLDRYGDEILAVLDAAKT
ncbi:MAG: ATP-dependent helicase [Acidimicrobiales bacterium]